MGKLKGAADGGEGRQGVEPQLSPRTEQEGHRGIPTPRSLTSRGCKN